MYTKEVVLHDKGGRGHTARLVRHSNGELYLEVEAHHQGHIIYSTLQLGEAWALWPQLAPLAT